MTLLSDPLVQTAGLPLGLSFLVGGLMRVLLGPGRGAALAALGIPLGLLAAYVAILGTPPLEPRGAQQKLFHIVVLAAALGALIAWSGRGGGRPVAVLVLAVTAAEAWLFEARLRSGTFAQLWPLAAVWVGTLFAADRLARAGASDRDAPVMLLVAALGLGVVALLGASASYGQLGFALAAATGGFLLWNWPWARWPLEPAGLLGGGTALLALVAAVATFAPRADKIALALLLLCFVTPTMVRHRLPPGGPWRPVLVGIAAAIPAAAAAVIAHLSAGAGGY
jgi:hypothetical protein